MEMAPSLSSSPAPMPESAQQLPSPGALQPNLRNPLPLSAAQEAQVKAIYYKRVRDSCAAEVKEFAECARSRTVTATWLCRAQRLAMNGCMIAHATPMEEDAAREEWFAGRGERRRKREEDTAAVEKRRVEVIEMTRRQEEVERKRQEEAERTKEQEKITAEKKGKGWWG